MSKMDEIDFVQKIHPVYKAIKSVSSEMILKNKNITFIKNKPIVISSSLIRKKLIKKA